MKSCSKSQANLTNQERFAITKNDWQNKQTNTVLIAVKNWWWFLLLLVFLSAYPGLESLSTRHLLFLLSLSHTHTHFLLYLFFQSFILSIIRFHLIIRCYLCSSIKHLLPLMSFYTCCLIVSATAIAQTAYRSQIYLECYIISVAQILPQF